MNPYVPVLIVVHDDIDAAILCGILINKYFCYLHYIENLDDDVSRIWRHFKIIIYLQI